MKYTVKNFPNKLKALVVEDTSSPSVAILVLVGIGARFEREIVNGVAHWGLE